MSVGTIWSVGGLAPTSAGVPDGRGGLLGSGTNAPLYTTSFISAKPRAKEDLELHESRIAQALDMDRVGRILEFRDTPPLPRPSPPSRDQSQNMKPELKTAWEGTEWVLGGPDRSMYSCCMINSCFYYSQQILLINTDRKRRHTRTPWG